MRFRAIVFLLCIAAHLPVAADEALRSDAALEANTVEGCRHAAERRGEEALHAKRVCECVWEVLAEHLTRAEFVVLDGSVARGNRLQDLPAWSRIQPKLLACAAKARAAAKAAP